METANAARCPPNASSGIVYMFTLNAEIAKMLSEMPAAAQAAPGASGMAAVASDTTEAATHTRKRARRADRPRATSHKESQPPETPPTAARTGGIHEYQAAWTSVRPCTSTR